MSYRTQFTAAVLLFMSTTVTASDDIDAIRTEAQDDVKTAGVPFLYSSENMGTALGAAGVVHGLGPTNASLVMAGLYSSNDSGIAAVALFNTGFAQDSRWRFDAQLIEGHYTTRHIYVSGNPKFVNASAAGSNDSDRENYIVREMISKDYLFRAKWLTPLGDGANGYQPIGNRAGLPFENDTDRPTWNPLTTGQTSIDAEVFYRLRDTDQPLPDEYEAQGDRSSGVKVALDYDNRNGSASPTAGARTRFFVTQDWGAGNSTSYTKLEISHAQYFSLGSSDWFRQQVLAANVYASDIPTWDADDPDSIPPWFVRSSLGGWNQLRGYSGNRFTGKSAIHYSAELRGITRKNWLGDSFLGNYYHIPWMELAVFVDTGRVADEWDMGTLHKDMKISYGGSLRFMVEGIPMRFDLAQGDEGLQYWVFVNQPF